MDAGELVPDAVIIGMVRERLGQPDGRKGFVLDGFPRTAAQAEALDQLLDAEGTPLDRVVLVELSDEELAARLTGRRVCGSCGRNYHVAFSPPKTAGRCDHCGGALTQRADDEEATVRRRLAVYARDTRPLIDYYRGRGLLTTISGAGTMDTVHAALVGATGGLR
jgi:adenylate kinase